MLAFEIILWIAIVYLLCGILFAIPFALVGAADIDEGAQGAPWGFKLIIIPGTAIFWPLLLGKWIRARRSKRGKARTR